MAQDQVSRLYLAYFLRPADDTGRDYWVGRMVGGLSLAQVSDELARSPEFAARYGNLDHTAFVDLIYRNVLRREPDVAGQHFWTSALNAGSTTRGTVMVGFSESPEFKERVARQQLRRLYLAYFLREPDSEYWLQQMMSGSATERVSAAFALSPEFTALYGTVDDNQFVHLVYRNVLQREPDPAGLENWTNALNSGSLTRGAVVLRFSESIEFIARVG